MRTQALHARAERTGLVSAMLAGNASRDGYVLLLRNLLPAYQEIERGLDTHRQTMDGLARPEMYRGTAIEADLAALGGADWRDRLTLLPAAARYAHRVAVAARGDGMRLIAHAYVRYLGDLSGGQMLKRLLARTLGLPTGALAFHEFPAIPDLIAFKTGVRAALDRMGHEIGDTTGVVEEAAVAFRLNIHVSEAAQLAVERLRARA